METRAAVIGIPNSGKYSFINKLAGKNIATVGNKPGVTRAKQWIKTNYNVELMDTPGILWPKLDQEEVGLHLAYTGAIKYEVLDTSDLLLKFIEEIMEKYPNMWVPAGICIIMAVLAFNFVGDGLRDAFDPKMKR